MVITLLAIGIVLLGFVFLLIYHLKGGYSEWSFATEITLVLGGIFLLVCLIAIGFKEPCADVHVKKFEAVQMTLDYAREATEISRLELVTIQKKAVEKNEGLASMKVWAKHPLTNWFYSKKVLQIKPIR